MTEPIESDFWLTELNEYREASSQHSESHYEAGTDPELCDEFGDCPHWPSWWTKQGLNDES